jgi:hypothetical protein
MNEMDNVPAVVAVFDDRLQAEKAVDALEQAGFPAHSIGYVIRGLDAVNGGMITDAEGAKDVRGATAGAITGGMVGGVVAAAATLLIPGVGPFVAGGVLASFFGGTIAGTAIGGMLGAMRGLGISEHEARFYETQFHEGRAIVAVKAGPRAAEAIEILARFSGLHIHSEAHSPIPTAGVFHTP